jgi:SAM-dependent methyltransferase
MHQVDGTPSPWVQRFAALVPAGGRVLDLACGSGRHLRWLAGRGVAVTGVDRDAAALQLLQGLGELITADIERDPWPLAGRQFDAVVVANYLWRPLFTQVLAALAPGGLLLYETFADGQQTIGRPARPEFLLQPGELLQRCAGLRVVAFEDGFEDGLGSGAGQAAGAGRFVQRIAAVAPVPGGAAPAAKLPPPHQPPTGRDSA